MPCASDQTRCPLCRALVLLALVRAAVATTPTPTPVPTRADKWGALVGVASRTMSFPTAQYTNLFDSEVTARAQRRQRQHHIFVACYVIGLCSCLSATHAATKH